VLLLQGSIDVVKSNTTGKQYITAHKVSMVCTLDQDSCKEQIGTKLPGSIEKVSCAPYEFMIPQSGEKVMLNYTYQYNAENVSAEEAVFAG
jgi:hypothetical protein